MNRSQALKEAVRRWGKNGMVRDKGKAFASTPEQREAARLEYAKLRDQGAIRKLTREERELRDQWLGKAMRHRYSVGHILMLGNTPFAFSVEGEGDTWEQAFEEAERKHKAAA